MSLNEKAEMLQITDDVTPDFKSRDVESINDSCQQPDDSAIEKPAITDLQTAADEFNAAFNTALYELESSRKLITERSIRIDELNDSIKSVNDALNEEVSKNRKIEEELQKERQQLHQRIQEIEAERDHLHQQSASHEDAANKRADEIEQLSSRLEELNGILDQRAAEGERAREEYSYERDMLTGELNEIKEQIDSANDQIVAQRNSLEESNQEIADLNSQIEKLTSELTVTKDSIEQIKQESSLETAKLGAKILELNKDIENKENLLEDHQHELQSRINEVATLNENITGLKSEIDAQAESHARANEELENQFQDVSAELESLHATQSELREHSEKLEKLNRALHESSISENDLHKRILDDKETVIKSLREKLAADSDPTDKQDDSSSIIEDLQSELRNLHSKLEDTEALQNQVNNLQSLLDTARSEQEAQVDKLHNYETLEQEVMGLRESTREGGKSDDIDVIGALRQETAELKSALSASEEKCTRLQTELSNTLKPDSDSFDCQLPAIRNSQTVASISDRNQFVSNLNTLLSEQACIDNNHTVMYILLDNFIRIRDEVGVVNSEQVISEISAMITTICGDSGTISRFGDCTFAILSSPESTDETQEKAEKIRAMIEHHIFEVSGHSIITSTSIGICSIRDTDTSAEDVISRADLSCETARSSGGNMVVINSAVDCATANMGSSSEHEAIVNATLNENRIITYYQQISCLKDTSGKYYEILVRIVDTNGDIILPGEFFSMAESSGKAMDIDLHVIEKVICMLAESRDNNITMFIKLTRQSVADQDFPLWVIGKIKEYNINPEQLVFEIAESSLESNLKELSMLSRALHTIGCKIAIEHYRMSTQLQHLLHIHADYLKIDSGLIESISRKGKSLEQVSAIMDIARKKNYITVAEGVENSTSLAILWELGVNLAQGYFIQPPTGEIEIDSQDMASEIDAENSNKSTYTIE